MKVTHRFLDEQLVPFLFYEMNKYYDKVFDVYMTHELNNDSMAMPSSKTTLGVIKESMGHHDDMNKDLAAAITRLKDIKEDIDYKHSGQIKIVKVISSINKVTDPDPHTFYFQKFNEVESPWKIYIYFQDEWICVGETQQDLDNYLRIGNSENEVKNRIINRIIYADLIAKVRDAFSKITHIGVDFVISEDGFSIIYDDNLEDPNLYIEDGDLILESNDDPISDILECFSFIIDSDGRLWAQYEK